MTTDYWGYIISVIMCSSVHCRTYLGGEVRLLAHWTHCVHNGSHSSHWPPVSHCVSLCLTIQAKQRPNKQRIVRRPDQASFVPACSAWSAASPGPIRGRGWVQSSWWRQPACLTTTGPGWPGGGRQTGSDLPIVMIILRWDGLTACLALPHTLTLPHSPSHLHMQRSVHWQSFKHHCSTPPPSLPPSLPPLGTKNVNSKHLALLRLFSETN